MKTRYEATRITITQELEQRTISAVVQLQQQQQPGYNVQLEQPQQQPRPQQGSSSANSGPSIASKQQQPPPCYPNFYQGATISEIDESTVEDVVRPHPQAVQASPVLVLQHTDNNQQRLKLRQKALVESVESKV